MTAVAGVRETLHRTGGYDMSAESIPPGEESGQPKHLRTPTITVEEYFALDRASEVRLEYIEGEIHAMAGESPTHNVIVGNLYYQFRLAFENRECHVYFEGIRTRVSSARYRYPDIAALCGDAVFDDENPPSL